MADLISRCHYSESLGLVGDGSGWAEAITAANVTTEGRVDAL